MNVDILKICKVCGWDHGDYTWGADGKTASFEICDCCGTEFGYHDCNIASVIAKRNSWIAAGAPWHNKKSQPANWDYRVYLSNIPEIYRS